MSKNSAGLLFYCHDDNTVLLTLRSKNVSSSNTWDVQGGQYDKKDQSSINTSFREAQEELGSLPIDKTLIGFYQLPKSRNHKNKYDIYIYEITSQEKENWTSNIKLDEETDLFKWFNINKLPKNTHFDLTWIPNILN